MSSRLASAVFIATLMAAHGVAAQTTNPVTSDTLPTGLTRFSLDYQVPESPAFAALGVTPNQVLRGTAAKPIAVHILNAATTAGRVQHGVAVDVIPTTLVGTTFTGLSDYYGNSAGQRFRRFLSRLSVSLATATADTDTSSVRGALGLRYTFTDTHDPLQNEAVARSLSSRILPLLDPDFPVAAVAEDEPPVDEPVDLSSAYTAVRDSLQRARNHTAVSGGVAIAALLRNSVASLDSLADETYHIWASAQFAIAERLDVLGTLKYADPFRDSALGSIGVALRYNAERVSVSGEAVLQEGGQFDPAFTAEFRFVRQIGIVTSLVSQKRSSEDGSDHSFLRFKTHIRWNLSEIAGGER